MRLTLFLMLSVLFWCAGSAFFPPEKGTLQVELSNVKTAQGNVWIAVYDSEENFLVEEKARVSSFKVQKTGTLLAQIPDLDFGDYAFAVFHDLNGNKQLDFNFLGIPAEPFAFSKKLISRFRPPRFDEVKFDFKDPDQIVQAKLSMW